VITRLLGLRVRILSWVSVFCEFSVCCQVEVSVMRRLHIRRSPTVRGVSESDRGTSQSRPRPTGGVSNHEEKK
jgi:hypothetical protein